MLGVVSHAVRQTAMRFHKCLWLLLAGMT
jgi:hypothetical protein